MELTTALSSAPTAEAIASLSTRLGSQALGASSSVLWTHDDAGDLRLLAAHGVPDEALAPLRYFARDADVPGDEVLPLVCEGKTLGVISFRAGPRHAFASEERTFLTAVATRCAEALARARLYEDARRAERRLTTVLWWTTTRTLQSCWRTRSPARATRCEPRQTDRARCSS
ncbi:MAG TPA: GAF domain-containing protein [Polyangiaceae bacterium]|nr:GAF domain-containing protein [Polyangiaceae bacterium]